MIQIVVLIFLIATAKTNDLMIKYSGYNRLSKLSSLINLINSQPFNVIDIEE